MAVEPSSEASMHMFRCFLGIVFRLRQHLVSCCNLFSIHTFDLKFSGVMWSEISKSVREDGFVSAMLCDQSEFFWARSDIPMFVRRMSRAAN